ncbi:MULTISPECIES: gas vesicle protein GvpO [unclassified Nonomuraea]|uniref:gas vesicle protein GvpO n=1 Tax=unclassified Nonomuraea TaxID=2593643 RepID=UPI00340CA7CA
MPARRRGRADDTVERERDDLSSDDTDAGAADGGEDEDAEYEDPEYEEYEDEAADDDEPADENENENEDEGEDEDEGEYEDEGGDGYEEEPRRRLSAATAGETGLRHIAGLTAREPEGVTLVKPGDNGWTVDVEVVEDRRIPSSGDILALYEAELDAEGDLLSYRRLRRYRRGSGDSERG